MHYQRVAAPTILILGRYSTGLGITPKRAGFNRSFGVNLKHSWQRQFSSKQEETPTFECKTSINIDAIISAGEKPDLVGSIDQGTSSTRFLVFTSLGQIAASAQMEHTQIYKDNKPGWHEHNPIEIWENTRFCIQNVVRELKESDLAIDLKRNPLKAIGITNQRETTIAWNSETGKPYHNAIVWDCVRTNEIASEISKRVGDLVTEKTGLPLASYFAGTKVRWLLDNVPELRKDLQDKNKCSQVRFGTIDSWLVYQLTGSPSSHDGAANVGGLFVTDVTNASRWLFMDLKKLQWDQDLVDKIFHGTGISLPVASLPEIKSSSTIYGKCEKGVGAEELEGVKVSGILGDQHAALFGQTAFEPGEAKNTYGTGLFLMMNAGASPVQSSHGLLSTVGYQLENEKPVYALEGSISHAGSTIRWLRDQLQIITDASESETLAKQTNSNDGLYFVPAFAGLFAPYWRPDARACIVGMTASHTKSHFARAALEASAYQTKDVFDAIYADSNVPLKELRVDGGGTANDFLMQFQTDMLGVPVVKPVVKETTGLGAAFAAGLAVGVWKDLSELKGLWEEEDRFIPKMDEKDRKKNLSGWKKAISKSLNWIEEDE